MSVTYPSGFLAAGIAAGIKPGGRRDLALVFSPEPAVAAAVSTTNRFKAASLIFSLKQLRKKSARAVLLNSGNANALNGREGMAATRRLVDRLALEMDIAAGEIVFASTGKIGLLLPEATIAAGFGKLVAALGPDGAPAAEAIMTTDRRPKETARQTEIEGRAGFVRIGGMAKGAGMIRPELATMLSVLTTDAVIAPDALQEALSRAVQDTFNQLTVDDDQSTNDFVVVLANGAAGNHRLKIGQAAFAHFQAELTACCRDLARQMAADGEGAEKMLTVRVTGAWSSSDARRIARRVAGSNLVKSMLTGDNPNWGRILAAAGSCAARIRPERIRLAICGVAVYDRAEIAAYDEKALSGLMKAPEVLVELDLDLGNFSAEAFGCNLTEEYVRINREYS